MTCVTVTPSIVAATTSSAMASSGTCYIWEISGGRAYSFRYLNTADISLTSSGTTIAILHASGEPWENYVTTWNLTTKKAYLFPVITCQDREWLRSHESKIILDKSGKSVVLFQLIERKCWGFYFVRLNLEGRVCANGYLEVSTQERTEFHLTPVFRRPLSNAKLCTIWSFTESDCDEWYHCIRDLDKPTTLLRVVYDSDKDCLRLDRHPIHLLLRNSLGERVFFQDLFFWKDVAYYRVDYHEVGLKVVDLKYEICGTAPMGRYISDDFERTGSLMESTDRNGFGLPDPLLFGDETYLVNVFPSGFVAWCFDKHVTMVYRDEGYRSFMKDSMGRRSIGGMNGVGPPEE